MAGHSCICIVSLYGTYPYFDKTIQNDEDVAKEVSLLYPLPCFLLQQCGVLKKKLHENNKSTGEGMKKLVVVIILMMVGSLQAGRFTFKNPFKRSATKQTKCKKHTSKTDCLLLVGALFSGATLDGLTREPQAVTNSYARVPSGPLVLKEHLD